MSKIRILVVDDEIEVCETLEMFDGKVEVDESYFGGRRKGKRG